MENKNLKLSTQAIATFALVIQKCILEQKNVVDIFRTLELDNQDGELVVLNPPAGIDLEAVAKAYKERIQMGEENEEKENSNS